MSWVTCIWSAASGACLVLAILHFLVWCSDRQAKASLVFALMALSVVGVGVCEQGMMRSATPEAFNMWLRWMHVPGLTAIAGAVVFVRLYFGTGRPLLGGLTLGVRLAAVVMNFCLTPNINFREIRSLVQIPFLGDEVSIVGEAVVSHWVWLAQASFVFWLAYTVDASVSLWKRGSKEGRRRALGIGGSMSIFILLGMTHTVLTLHGVIHSPVVWSLIFGLMTLAMGYELSRDVLRASRLEHDLHESELRLSLAASAAGIAVWEWDVLKDRIRVSSIGRKLYGVESTEDIDYARFDRKLHPDDRQRVRRAIDAALAGPEPFAAEYRAVLPDGSLRWIAASGQVERDAHGQATLLRGVSTDITARRLTEQELHQEREQLSHTLRLATMSQMATSLAHELNQPLTAMANNAGAARRMLAKGTASDDQLSEILTDIVDDAHRAGEVIRGMRGMARRDHGPREAVDLNALVATVQRLVAAEALVRDCELVAEAEASLPWVNANPVQLQQVLLNLLMNAFEASELPGGVTRRVILRTESEGESAVRVSVRDHGPGLPPEGAEKWFEPFHTSKPNGLGMGLVIVRGIVEAHGGALRVDAADGGGACFHFRLPAAREMPA
ncbi:ATP-binding protein [Luteolibacter soli]|uniref:histidine kinase n=1 Tax=Luteolibacter soli TaxID=3135280 RepID=A0ABU9ANB4_9BACT